MIITNDSLNFTFISFIHWSHSAKHQKESTKNLSLILKCIENVNNRNRNAWNTIFIHAIEFLLIICFVVLLLLPYDQNRPTFFVFICCRCFSLLFQWNGRKRRKKKRCAPEQITKYNYTAINDSVIRIVVLFIFV